VAHRHLIDRIAVTLPMTSDIADAVDAVREYLNEMIRNG